MCTNKLTIINPKYKAEHCTFNKYYDPLFLRVPCGKCQECQNNKQQEWITRLAAEYEYTESIGGFVYKDMLTYNEWNVPHWHGLKTFNPEHIKAFMKKLRTYLVRHYERTIARKDGGFIFNQPYAIETYAEEKLSDDDSYTWDIQYYTNKQCPIYPDYHPAGKLKVFIVCEYGDNTSRPHYHLIAFVQFKISPWVFARLIKKSWIYGFTSNKPLQNNIINSMAGIGYATKYLCKDIEFVKVLTSQKNSYFISYLEGQWKKLYNEDFDKENFAKYPCETIKKILKDLGMQNAVPFFKASRYIGVSALQNITKEEWESGKMKMLTGERNGRTYKMVSIPMYLQRKMYYDYNKVVKAWELNDKGIIMKQANEERKLHKCINKLELTFNQPGDIVEGYTEIGTEWKNGYEIRRPIDKSVCYKIYNDLKKNTNSYALLLNLLTYRDNIINLQILEELEQGKTYTDFIKNAIRDEWENARIFKEHKPHTHFIELYKRGELYTWSNIITDVTKDPRYLQLLNAYDQLQNTKLLNKERWLIHQHKAWVEAKKQEKRKKV